MATKVLKKNTTAAKKQPEKKVVVVKKTNKEEEVDASIYPIGKYKKPEKLEDASIKASIKSIQQLPKKLKKTAKKISNGKQLQSSYKNGGWSIEQIIHHLADSHMNAFIRFKLALTENNPTIKPYDQDLWSETSDIQIPIKTSIELVKNIHKKWSALMKNMDINDLKRTYFHPEYKEKITLLEVIDQYAWHGNHHVAQIEVALKKANTKNKKVKKEKTEKKKATEKNSK